MIFISFSDHIKEANHRAEIEALVSIGGGRIDEFVQTERTFNMDQPLVPQVVDWLAAVEFERLCALKKPFLIFPPSLNYVSAVLLALMHGATGDWPSILRIRPVDSGGVRSYAIAEIINLNQVRNDVGRGQLRTQD